MLGMRILKINVDFLQTWNLTFCKTENLRIKINHVWNLASEENFHVRGNY